MFHREVKDFSVYSWLFVTPGFYPVSTDDLLEANVRFCLKPESTYAAKARGVPHHDLAEADKNFSRSFGRRAAAILSLIQLTAINEHQLCSYRSNVLAHCPR